MKTSEMTKMLAGAFLLCATALTGCSQNEDANNGNPLEIRLGAGLQVTGGSTRAAINTGSKFKAGIAGWESTTAPVDYASTAATWSTKSTITAAETAGAIVLDEAKFYSGNASTVTYMKAWYPTGDLQNGIVTFSGNDFTTNGTTDVMLAGEINGSSTDNGLKNFKFEHKLTQLKFVILGDAGFQGDALTSIAIKGAELPTGLNLATNMVTYATAADLLVPETASQIITDKAATTGLPVMIKPIKSQTFKIDVVTTDGTTPSTFNDIIVTIDDDVELLAGKAYTITLSFGSAGINASASVTPWTEGTGSGTIK